MQCSRKITEDLYYVGADDHRLALFENIHPIYHGVSYNSYVLLDESTVLFDTADWAVGQSFLENVTAALGGRSLDYMIINHMEPDHAATIGEIILRWPKVKIVTTQKAMQMMSQFGFDAEGRVEVVKDGDSKSFGKHNITFVMAPMVHWPEVMVSFDTTDGILFSADAFGSFKALDGKLYADEVKFDAEWLDEARRYYTNIVGKFGMQVSTLLNKASKLDIKMICPLHGPIWRKDLGYILDKYTKWASYTPEEKGLMIVYASMYGHTENVAEALAAKLADKGYTNTRLYDVSSTHVSYLISDMFKYSHIVLASVTYNLGIFPPMHSFLADMKALNLQKRTAAILENGSWAPTAAKQIRQELSELKDMNILDVDTTIVSAAKDSDNEKLDRIVDELIKTL